MANWLRQVLVLTCITDGDEGVRVPPEQTAFAAPRTPLDDLIDVIKSGNGGNVPLQLRQNQQFPTLQQKETCINLTRPS